MAPQPRRSTAHVSAGGKHGLRSGAARGDRRSSGSRALQHAPGRRLLPVGPNDRQTDHPRPDRRRSRAVRDRRDFNCHQRGGADGSEHDPDRRVWVGSAARAGNAPRILLLRAGGVCACVGGSIDRRLPVAKSWRSRRYHKLPSRRSALFPLPAARFRSLTRLGCDHVRNPLAALRETAERGTGSDHERAGTRRSSGLAARLVSPRPAPLRLPSLSACEWTGPIRRTSRNTGQHRSTGSRSPRPAPRWSSPSIPRAGRFPSSLADLSQNRCKSSAPADMHPATLGA